MKMIPRSSRSKSLIARLLKALDQQAKEAPEHLGLMSYTASDNPIDAGGYGNPHEDTRPAFVKEDDIGWLRSKR